MPDEITSKAFAAADQIPFDVAAYLRHVTNNKLTPIFSTLEIFNRNARDGHICGIAMKTVWELKEAIDNITEPAIKKGDTNVPQSNPA